MHETNPPGRLKRGNTSQDRPGFVFFRYHRGREYWVTIKQFKRAAILKRAVQAKVRKKPAHREYMRNYLRAYYHRPKQKARHAAYYARPEVLARLREIYANDPKRIAKRKARSKWIAERTAYRASDAYKAKRAAEAKVYYWKHQKKIHARIATRRRRDGIMRLKQNLSRRIRYALNDRRASKTASTVVLIGCTIREFRIYLETKFKPGMTWANYGKEWELDHRVPLSSFILADPEQQKIAFHFRNHQPLWKTDNRRKSDKLADGTLGRKIIRFARFV